MKFQSTRDEKQTKYAASQVIKQGLADDGGLFVPERIPAITLDEINGFCSLPYPVLAAEILSKFLSDYTYDELLCDCNAAYNEVSFKGGISPCVKIDKAPILLSFGTVRPVHLRIWHSSLCQDFFPVLC